MQTAIRVEHISKEYRLGVINHGMLYKDMQTWIARKLGRPDPHAQIGAEYFADQKDRFWALKDISFDIKQGDRIGIIGRNGAGKSTLLKILSRITAPTEGTVKLKGRVTSLLEVGTGFHPELTGRENIYLNGAILGMKRIEVEKKLDEIIEFSEIAQFIDTPVKRYSSGMYVRLAFSVAAHLDSEILMADEVLAVGDAMFQNKCLGKMTDVSEKEGRTVLFVSHQMNFISRLCRSAILLEKGKITDEGLASDVVQRYIADKNSYESVFFREKADTEKDVVITKLAIVNESGSPTSTVEMKNPCLVEIEYRVMRNVAGAFVSLHIYSSDKALLIDSCDIDSHPTFLEGRKPGVYSFRVEVPSQTLNAGHYSASAWAGIPQQNITFSDTPQIGFEIVDTGSTISIHNQTRGCTLGTKFDWESD